MQRKPDSGKVLLALDISPRSRAALQTAAMLAAELDTELVGLFVEDADLLRLSGLPFAREVGFLSPVSRRLGAREVEQALHREAEAVRRLLVEAASRAQLRWSFQVARGNIATELFALANELDLIVLGKRSRRGMRSLGEALNEPAAGVVRSNPVLAVFDGSACSLRALQLAVRQVRTSGAELQLLVSAATDAEYASHLDAVSNALADTGIATVASRRIIPGSIRELAAAVREAGASVLVLSSDGRFRGGEGFATLLNEVDCPVILVR